MRPLPRVLGPLVLLAFMVSCSDTPVSFQPDEAGNIVTQERASMVSPALIENAPPVPVPLPVRDLPDDILRNPGAKVVVDDDLACPGAVHATIQAGVDAALAGGIKTVEICAGTYPENVSIATGGAKLKLKGEGVGLTNVTGVAGTAGPIIDVASGGDVDIEKLTVDGGSAMAGGAVFGIRYDETDGKIKDVEVLNIRNASGSSQGLGIRVQSTTGAKTEVTVEKTLVDNYTRVGINGNGMGVDIKVHKNTVIGPAPPTVWAPNGIQISRGAEGDVKNNSVDNNPSPNVPGGAGSGIILFCAGDTKVHKNTVTRADLGISVVDQAGAKIHNNDVLDSDFDGISLQFLGLYFGDIGCTSPGTPLLVTDNDIHNNDILNSGADGISFASFDVVNGPVTPNDNKVHGNEIDMSGVDGIHVYTFGANPQDNELKSNKITTSGGTDAVDETAGGGTAGTANTWKNNKCTTSSPTGLCK